jgi:Coenzyme PQQ synthesis protein D (PqqD)
MTSIAALGSMPCRSERIAYRVIGGEALVMVVDRKALHRLNDVGSRVFELCDGQTSIDAIVEAIVVEFDVDAPTARADVQAFIRELAATGAISFKEAS